MSNKLKALTIEEAASLASPTVVTIVYPPSGWAFGFPAVLQEDYEQQLKDAGYPEEMMELALRRSRYWQKEI